MEYLIIIAIVLGILYALIVYVIMPLGGILGIASLVIGLGYALYTSIRSFVGAVKIHKDPYTTYVDSSPNASPGINRNYFFGPGFHQLDAIVKKAFSLQGNHINDLKDWRDMHLVSVSYRDIWIWLFFIIAAVFTYIFGFAWTLVFSILLSVVLIVGVVLFFLFFSVLWGLDRLILSIKAIQSRCSSCKRVSVVPTFICPDCGMEHKNLTPGPYGIYERKCSCGKRLPTTFINGRSELDAICPFCSTDLAASDARQFGIQLVGGVSTGKTTYLAAFLHKYLEVLSHIPNISVTLSPQAAFDELARWYEHGYSAATTETNAIMYSIIQNTDKQDPVQFTIYDIAGEAFGRLGNDTQQHQFNYCEGILFVVDPTTAPSHVWQTMSSFIQEFTNLRGLHPTKMADVPVVIMITKSDLYKKLIGLPKIKATHSANLKRNPDAKEYLTIDHVRNGICRDFLLNNDYGNTINLIEAQFNNIQFFPVSAMGHPQENGGCYEPWGVLEPVIWLMSQHSFYFNDIVRYF